jgi:hypothetical protein
VTGPTIHPRSAWGFPGWGSTPYAVADSARTEFFVHYEGGSPTSDTGAVAMRSIHAAHRVSGWSGIGYNFVVMLDGTCWEGRGWGLVGAHCPHHNTSGVGVQIHLGGAQQPTQAALITARALYDEACRRAGRKLWIMGHQDGYATECPGDILERWVRAGLPVPSAPTPTPTPTPRPIPREGPMLYLATADSLSPRPGEPGAITKGSVMDCSLNRRAHIPAGGSPLVGSYLAAGYVIPSCHGQDIVDAYPIDVATERPPAVVIDVPALADALALRLPAGYDAAAIAREIVADLVGRLAQ